jgi:hypothetical protein
MRMPGNAEIVRHRPALSECDSLCASPFLEARPEMARHVTIKQSSYLRRIVIVRDTRALTFQDIESFHQARLIRITHGRLAIRLNPFGVLDPQVVVNLLPQICVRMELLKHNHWSVSLPWCHGNRVSE